MVIDGYMNAWMLERVVFGLMIYREAAGEPSAGKVAVANTVMNRAAHPKWWGKTPWEVITKAKQYSSMTFLGDPMTIRYPADVEDPVLMECIQIAGLALDGRIPNVVAGADSYYSVSMKVPPKWADESKFVKQIGMHRFYNLDGDPAVVSEGSAA